MSSSRRFSFALWSAGPNALFAKPDMTAAYKNIPQHPSVWPSQGFFWLDRYFVDISTVFGSAAAVSQFDAFAATLQNLTLLRCPLPANYLHRQLDDLPIISPTSSALCSKFFQAYSSLCQELKVRLAPPCPQFDKSFGPTTHGTVLGIYFNSENLSWSLPKRKAHTIAAAIDLFLGQPTTFLPPLQHLLGLFNDTCLMFDFLRILRAPLQFFHNSFTDDKSIALPIPSAVKDDLLTWRSMLPALLAGLPIHPPPRGPPFTSLIFWSDAAAGIHLPPPAGHPSLPPRGVASLGGQSIFDTWFAARLTWPENLLTSTKDSRGNLFGHNSTTLETVGLLLPLLCIPHHCQNRPLLFYVDNLPLVYAFHKKYAKSDPETSLLLRCFFLLCSFLSCEPHIRYLPRCSTPLLHLADTLSRSHTTDFPLPTSIFTLTETSHPISFSGSYTPR
jgi:hypothetical protein